jgi:DNA-binding transcriptional LysR family regulator
MLRKIDWDGQIGRRLRLKDLHVFVAVAQRGAMSKAASQLGVSTPTVSEIIADLEHGVGVRLLDRGPHGVELTPYGQALLKRTLVVFDELKQGIKDIEQLDDPTTGEIRIAGPLAVASTIVPHIFDRFSEEYPRVLLHFDEVTAASAARNLQDLRDRKYDMVLGLGWSLPAQEWSADDLRFETLFEDQLVIAAGPDNTWARRRRTIDLQELIEEPWIMQGPQTWNYRNLAEACRIRGIALPKARLVTLSIAVISHFLRHREFLSAMPRSVAHFCGLKVLPVDLPTHPWPVNIATLKNRTLGPTVARFVECAREFARPLRERREFSKASFAGRRR